MRSQLANEVWSEILVLLPPSDIVRSVRKVSRHLYGLSKDRSLWLKIFLQCDYILPSINNSTSTGELERLLLRGELIKNVWTGKCPATPHRVREFEFRDSERFIGLVGEYLICDIHPWTGHEPPYYFWYHLESNQSASPRPAYQYDLNWMIDEDDDDADERVSKIHRRINTVLNEQNVLYILFHQMDRFSGEKQEIHLKLASITLLPSGTFKPKLEFSYHIKDERLLEFGFYEFVDPVPGCDYLAARPLDHTLPIHLFSISTGKVVLCPRHTKIPEDSDILGMLSFKLSPWHLVQILEQQYIEIYQLPTTQELNAQTGDSHFATRTHVVTLPLPSPTMPLRDAKPQLFFLSATSAIALLLETEKLRTFHLDLSTPNNIQIRPGNFDSQIIRSGHDGFGSQLKANDFPSVSSSSKSRLGVVKGEMTFRTCGPEQFFFPLWIGRGSKKGATITLPAALKLPEMRNLTSELPEYFGLRFVDAYLGRVAFETNYRSDDSGTYRILVVDYVHL